MQKKVNSGIILFIGNDKPHKNISGLLDSFSNIKKEYPEFKEIKDSLNKLQEGNPKKEKNL